MKLLGFSWLLGRWRGMDIRFHISMLLSLPVAYWLFCRKIFLAWLRLYCGCWG